eukprot:3466818-Pleurochrysis_carterae.AAC.2
MHVPHAQPSSTVPAGRPQVALRDPQMEQHEQQLCELEAKEAHWRNQCEQMARLSAHHLPGYQQMAAPGPKQCAWQHSFAAGPPGGPGISDMQMQPPISP